ncbi:hypothetical protein B0H14DRAFT_3494856 [Mycena olivaceomarginata]|nr:hypothetical protein B0H14DRAFT_3494856 [Mycena olivaceomarginata]
MVRVLKDIGVDTPALGLIEEAPVDYGGVDLLATTLLDGLSSWFCELDQDDWAVQPWYETFTKVLQLLRDEFAKATSWRTITKFICLCHQPL